MEAEAFNIKLYSNNDRQTEDPSMETMNIAVTCLNTCGIKKEHIRMSRGKIGDADGLSINLIRDASNFLLDKIIKNFAKCLQTGSVPINWKIFL